MPLSASFEIMLHAFWLPDSYVVDFWLEEDQETNRPVTAIAHPRTCSREQLEEILPERLQAFEPDETRYLDTPVLNESRVAGPGDVIGPDPTLRRFKIATIESLTDDAIEYFLAHSVRTEEENGAKWAPSLQYWRVLVDFSQYLVDERLYMPGVITMQQKLYGSWRAVIPPDLEDRWCQLANAVPAICRNFCLDEETENCRNPGLLALSFVDACVDHMVRHHLGLRPPTPVKGKGKSTLPRQWMAQLRKPVLATELKGTATQLSGFATQVNKWNSGMRPMPGESGLRVGFRLISPQESEESWQLEFLLCSIRDPAVQVEAKDVWEGTVPADICAGAILQEVLLGGLGSASQAMPELGRALEHTAPVELEMTKGQAMEFLDGTVDLLEKEGFPVILPSWLRSSQEALGLRVKIAPRSGITYDREHVLGVEQLVSYQWQVSMGDTILCEDEFRALAQSNAQIVYHGGQWMRLDGEALQATVKLMDEHGTSGEATLAGALEAGLAMPAKGGLPILDIQVQGDIGRLFSELRPGEGFDVLETPEGLNGTLRDYQGVGFSWMWFLRQLGFGACLADDMGLGKTIQTITLLLRDHRNNPQSGTSLVVCPMSVVGNWEREFQKFSPDLKIHVHHGSDRVVYDEFHETVEKADVVITTYTLLVRDQLSFLRGEWRNVILDEAQNIKNPTTKQTIAARSLKAAYRFCLTGTPVENRLTELWSIMEFLNPGYLGDLGNFRANFALPIERAGDSEQLTLLRKIVKPFVLRRLKTDRQIIRDLPEKQEMKVYCNLTSEQATMYQEVVDDMLAKLSGREGIARKGIVLATLTKLKQITNHPLHYSRDSSAFKPERSGKYQCMEEMLEVVLQEGDKALIFTQFTEMGKLMETQLQQRFGVEVFFLHGGTPQWRREEMVNRFQRDGGPPIFILSLKAGGTGLNLTAASHVFHFDRWWNPAVEDQATDRAYRIGQTRNVQVHKLISIGTVEEKVDQMIEQKKELATNIVPSGEQLIVNLSTDQLRDIFALSASAVSE